MQRRYFFAISFAITTVLINTVDLVTLLVNPADVSVVEVVSGGSNLSSSLAANGLLSQDQIQIASVEAQRSGETLEKTLLRLGFVTEALIKSAEQELTGVQSIDLAMVLPDADALKLVSVDVARRFQLVPVSLKSNVVLIAVVDLYNLPALDRLKATIDPSIELKLALAGEREMAEAIDRFYGFELSIDGILHEIETGVVDTETINPDGDYHQPVVRLVDAILSDAVRHRASDIHLEPEMGFARIRYRIDGVMRQIRSFHLDYWVAIVVRIKVLAELNIAETRAPQDGQLSMNVSGGNIDFRVSCMPTVHGENLVLRILDRQKGIVPLSALGLENRTLDELTKAMNRPEGLILITGPTGSGKTTTLYSMLAEKSDERINIMTLEDPVEYPMAMLRQTSVNEQVKLNFSSGIKSILRQDPDVILVGEIRDSEAAEMVFRASMTGHQVYSTLHANTAIGALARLKDLGATSAVVGGNVIAIVGQRLVRKLCGKCCVEDDSQLNTTAGFKAKGCESCDWQGYKGRVAVMEVLRVTPSLQELIINDENSTVLLKAARQDGYITLADEALRLVRNGITSMTEVSRVIDITN